MFGRTTADAARTCTATASSPQVRRTGDDPRDRSRATPARHRRGHSDGDATVEPSAPASIRRRRPAPSAGHEFYTEEGASATRRGRQAPARSDRRAHVDAVEVPARAERDGAARDDFLVERGLRDSSERRRQMPLPAPDPLDRRRHRRHRAWRSRNEVWLGSRSARSAAPSATHAGARRRRRDAVRPLPRCTGALRARGRAGVRHAPSMGGSWSIPTPETAHPMRTCRRRGSVGRPKASARFSRARRWWSRTGSLCSYHTRPNR